MSVKHTHTRRNNDDRYPDGKRSPRARMLTRERKAARALKESLR